MEGKGKQMNTPAARQNDQYQLEPGMKEWFGQQKFPVDAVINTTAMSLFGAASGFLVGGIVNMCSLPGPNYQPSTEMNWVASKFGGGAFKQARNFAVLFGVGSAISCYLKELKGKEDVESCMVAGFGSGAAYALVGGCGGPFSTGIMLALVRGALFEPKLPNGEVSYNKTRGMLSSLGLQGYEKNFKRGSFTDTTLPLLTDSAMQEVKIPPGPRLLILDHIKREADRATK